MRAALRACEPRSSNGWVADAPSIGLERPARAYLGAVLEGSRARPVGDAFVLLSLLDLSAAAFPDDIARPAAAVGPCVPGDLAPLPRGRRASGGGLRLIDTTLGEISQGSGALELSSALLFTWWLASQGMLAVVRGINNAYETVESRPWWKTYLVASGLTAACLLLFAGALLLLVYGGQVSDLAVQRRGGSGFLAWIGRVLSGLVVLGCVLAAFNLIYVWGPNLAHRKWHWLMPGTLAGVAPGWSAGCRSTSVALGPDSSRSAAAQPHRLDPAAEAQLFDQAAFAAVGLKTDRARREELLLIKNEGRARASDDALDVALELARAAAVERLQVDRANQGQRVAAEIALIVKGDPAASAHLLDSAGGRQDNDGGVGVVRGRASLHTTATH